MGARHGGDGAVRGEVRRHGPGDQRRRLGPMSCAAAHMRSAAASLGVVTFPSEGSIRGGVRRLEALVGSDAYRFLAREHVLVNRLTELVKVRPEDLPGTDRDATGQVEGTEREISRAKSGPN